MEPSIGMHYQVLASITAVIVSLLLMVFVTVFCACCQSKDKSHDLERTPILSHDQNPSGTDQAEYKSTDEHSQDKIVEDKTKTKHHAPSDESGVATGSEQSTRLSDPDQERSINTPDISDKSCKSTKQKTSQDRKSVSTLLPNSTEVHSKQHNSNDTNANHHNSGEPLLTSASVQVNPSTPKLCHKPHDGIDAGADHQYHNSGNQTAANQEEVKSKDVLVPVPKLNKGDYYLTSSDIKIVQDKTWKARGKWYQIGIRLGMSTDDLDTIRSAVHRQDDDDYFTDMLSKWLRRRDATWEALAKALRSEQVGYSDIADSIFTSSQVSTSAGLSAAVDSETITSISSMRTCEVGEIAFMCGCPTPCSIINHLGGKCPSAPKLFPFLNHNMLTKNDQNNLEEKLCREASVIVTEFTNLIKHMKKSFNDRKLDTEDIIISVLGIAPREPSTCPILETLDVEKDTTISGIIIHLLQKRYISFFNYHIVEYLIKEYGTDEDKAELDKYIAHFGKFCQRSVFEVPHHIHGQPPKDSKPLAIKVMDKDQWITSSNRLSKTSNFSLGDAKIVQKKIAEMLDLQNYGSLPLLDTSEGCVVLTFALPTVIMESVKPKLGTITNIETEKYSIHVLCGQPGKPFATNITSDSVSLQWTKPEYGVMHLLIHYLVYYRSVTGSWENKKVSITDASKECVTLDGLSRETDGTSSFIFKVKAVSKNGIKVESRESDPIQLSVRIVILLHAVCTLNELMLLNFVCY